jgi:hypothetical protein
VIGSEFGCKRVSRPRETFGRIEDFIAKQPVTQVKRQERALSEAGAPLIVGVREI